MSADSFTPELGQAIFSNTPWGGHQVPGYVEAGVSALGELVAAVAVPEGADEWTLWEHDPTNNVGPSANFENDVFALRAYCWCDGTNLGHADGCPPNFEFGDLAVCWYKHGHRGLSMSRPVTAAQWREIFTRCAASLP